MSMIHPHSVAKDCVGLRKQAAKLIQACKSFSDSAERAKDAHTIATIKAYLGVEDFNELQIMVTKASGFVAEHG